MIRDIRNTILDVLFDLGLISNAWRGYGSLGEFDHERRTRYMKWAVIFILLIICRK